jgi:hypothetical protein
MRTAMLALAIAALAGAAGQAWGAETTVPHQSDSGFSWTTPPQRGPGGRALLGGAKVPLATLPSDEKTALTLTLPNDPKSQLLFRYEFGQSGNNPLRFLVDSFTFKDGIAELKFHRASPDPGPPATPIYYSRGFSLGRPRPGDYRLRVVESDKPVLEQKWRVIENPVK